MTEAQIEHWIGVRVKACGGLYYKFVSPGNAGVPDRIVVTKAGRIIFLELKTDSGKLSPLQRVQISRLSACGADVRVVKGKAEAEKFIEEVFGG